MNSELINKLRYDPLDGTFFWAARRVDSFPSTKSAKTWNTKWADKIAGTLKDGYRKIYFGGKQHAVHRLAFLFMGVDIPSGMEVDHIDGNKDNNSWHNLRIVDRATNMKNRPKIITNTSGHVGVSYANRDKKWRAYLNDDGKQISLGYFRNKEDAIVARRAAELHYKFHANHGR